MATLFMLILEWMVPNIRWCRCWCRHLKPMQPSYNLIAGSVANCILWGMGFWISSIKVLIISFLHTPSSHVSCNSLSGVSQVLVQFHMQCVKSHEKYLRRKMLLKGPHSTCIWKASGFFFLFSVFLHHLSRVYACLPCCPFLQWYTPFLWCAPLKWNAGEM